VPRVFIPPQARKLAGCEFADVDAGSVREAISQLDLQFPGLADCLLQDGELRPGISVSVGGRVSGMGLYQKVRPEEEVHFIPAIGGG
jgi:hypothetical protein